jgi:hypothetical protein
MDAEPRRPFMSKGVAMDTKQESNLVLGFIVIVMALSIFACIVTAGCHYDALINVDLRRMPSCASEAGLEARGANPGPASRPADEGAEDDIQTGDEILQELIDGHR